MKTKEEIIKEIEECKRLRKIYLSKNSDLKVLDRLTDIIDTLDWVLR